MKDKADRIFAYISEHISVFGYPPTVREICAELDIRSTHGRLFIEDFTYKGNYKENSEAHGSSQKAVHDSKGVMPYKAQTRKHQQHYKLVGHNHIFYVGY